MRLRLIVALAFAVLAVAAGPGLRPTPAATARAERNNLVGVWTGTWTDGNGGAHGGAVEMIVTAGPDRPAAVAHLTFIDGDVADTVRREGRFTSRGLYFELVGGGTLVLELESGRLIGEFAGGPDVPVRYGLLDLTRKS
jgi:hypothetical protein